MAEISDKREFLVVCPRSNYYDYFNNYDDALRFSISMAEMEGNCWDVYERVTRVKARASLEYSKHKDGDNS